MGESRTARWMGEAMNEGYYIEVAENGPWLAQDLAITSDWEKRGVWPTEEDARKAITDSLTYANETRGLLRHSDKRLRPLSFA